MPAYVIVEVKIKDALKYEVYKQLAAPTVKKYGGKYIVRGGKAEKLEGNIDPERVAVLEFESFERAKEWWSSPEYSEVKKIRYATAESRMIVVEGLETPI